MRRALYSLFFLGVLACGLLLYWRVGRQEPKQYGGAPITRMPAAVPLPPPRLAPAVPIRPADNDAGYIALDEDSAMQQIRASLLDNPRLAETLAREGRQRFPDSPQADARDALLVTALMNQARIERARIEAYYYFDHHPDGRFGDRVSFLTRVRPRSAGQRP
ncbi:MAG: hypothetical protein WCG85_09165 [Polyangia bacterium]